MDVGWPDPPELVRVAFDEEVNWRPLRLVYRIGDAQRLGVTHALETIDAGTEREVAAVVDKGDRLWRHVAVGVGHLVWVHRRNELAEDRHDVEDDDDDRGDDGQTVAHEAPVHQLPL